MNILNRIDVLKTKHKELHARVEAAEAENAPDQFLKNMKVEKLKLKDEIERLESGWAGQDGGLEYFG
ncbi:hypothetical protein MelnitzEXVC044M_130 [Methylophilales phage Melnitz EXVC044M]|nr:hypothetical protein Melnitz1EXVC043M_129 [Methylophilales phage Melnitz-1 EXVC043M]QZI94636.1 hypothetical protein Melnitz2EXVC040M_130 [Methylophilales phage Melnitz-2 EXVC040M]QZI94858.1 hypothetical protein MelnitzEXVC044M_130 [Methylophilales phage Melnitz EXVC044M]QZI95079.1 hypothetical protein Melnitz3EXVC039M_130 [Methylophilales phage Melnitz-3 EXVC039M]